MTARSSVVVSSPKLYPKESHSEIRHRIQQKKGLDRKVNDFLSSCTLLTPSAIATDSDATACIERMRQTEQTLFTSAERSPGKGASPPSAAAAEGDASKDTSPARLKPSESKVKKPVVDSRVKPAMTNPAYEEALKERPAPKPAFTVELTALSMPWDMRKAKPSTATSTLAGLFSKPGEGPVPAALALSTDPAVNPRLRQEKKRDALVKHRMPKRPQTADPVESKMEKWTHEWVETRIKAKRVSHPRVAEMSRPAAALSTKKVAEKKLQTKAFRA